MPPPPSAPAPPPGGVPPAPGAPPAAASPLDFFLFAGRLKTTKRTGWVVRGVHLPESVADHSFRAALIALVLADAGGRDHATKLALAHDVAEAQVGDLTPHCGVSAAEKEARERAAMARVRDELLAGRAAGAELFALWEEYEAGATPAARLVKDVDKFEMLVSAYEYERREPALDLSEFYESTAGKFRTPEVAALVDELQGRREALLRERAAARTCEKEKKENRSRSSGEKN